MPSVKAACADVDFVEVGKLNSPSTRVAGGVAGSCANAVPDSDSSSAKAML